MFICLCVYIICGIFRERTAICDEITRWTQNKKRAWAASIEHKYEMFGTQHTAHTYTAHINYKQPSINIEDDEHSTSSELDTEMRTKHKLLYVWLCLLFFYCCPYYVSIFRRAVHNARWSKRMERDLEMVHTKKKPKTEKKSQYNSGSIACRLGLACVACILYKWISLISFVACFRF